RDLVPERACLERRAVVGRRLTHEVEPLGRPGAGGVEEVPVAADRIRPLEAPAELAAAVVVEKRRAAVAARKRPLLEAEKEDSLEAARARTQEVEHGDAARLGRRRRYFGALECGDQVLRCKRPTEFLPGRELVEQRRRGAEAAQVEARRLPGRR